MSAHLVIPTEPAAFIPLEISPEDFQLLMDTIELWKSKIIVPQQSKVEILDLDTPPEPEHKPHNPDSLTPEQVGVADGWRLLDEDEILPPSVWLAQIHAWNCENDNKWNATGWVGSNTVITYRTKLSRAELAAKRKGAK